MSEDKYSIPISGQRFSELLFRHFIVPTLASPPTETTTSWNDSGTRVDFRIGELVRIIENNSPIFYRLVDSSNGKAVWENISSGDFSKYYSKDDIDTIVQKLRNDIANTYISEIPQEYITTQELDAREYITSQALESKQDTIEDLDIIRENSNKVSEIVDENNYLISNGEKVDMRFTRSLLPIGTSIPAKANLNTKQYLKIGKYYCSLNADAKTITNCPVNVAFSMEVFNPLGTNVDDEDTKEYTYRMRVLTQYDTGQQYTQFCRTSGTPGTWTYDSWYITTRAKFTLNS